MALNKLATSEKVIPVKELSENSSSVPELENDSIENTIKKERNSFAQALWKAISDIEPKKDTHETSSKKGSSQLALENDSLEKALRNERSTLAQAYLLSVNDNKLKRGSSEVDFGETVLARRLMERNVSHTVLHFQFSNKPKSIIPPIPPPLFKRVRGMKVINHELLKKCQY